VRVGLRAWGGVGLQEREKQGKPLSILSDELSLSILRMVDDLDKSSFWDNAPLRHRVLSDAFPPTLLRKLGFDTLLRRVPATYLQAIFYSRLASRFVYKYGVSPSQFAFYAYMMETMASAAADAAATQ
jgi:glutamate dehydrogenase